MQLTPNNKTNTHKQKQHILVLKRSLTHLPNQQEPKKTKRCCERRNLSVPVGHVVRWRSSDHVCHPKHARSVRYLWHVLKNTNTSKEVAPTWEENKILRHIYTHIYIAIWFVQSNVTL